LEETSGKFIGKEYLELLLDNIKNYNYTMSSNNYEGSYHILKQCISNFYSYLKLKTFKEKNDHGEIEEQTYIDIIDAYMKEAEKLIFSINKNLKDNEGKTTYSTELKKAVSCLDTSHRLLIDCMHLWNCLLPTLKTNGGDNLGSKR